MQAWAENRAAAAALCSYHLRDVSNGGLHGAGSGLNASNWTEGLEDLPTPGWGNPPSAFVEVMRRAMRDGSPSIEGVMIDHHLVNNYPQRLGKGVKTCTYKASNTERIRDQYSRGPSRPTQVPGQRNASIPYPADGRWQISHWGPLKHRPPPLHVCVVRGRGWIADEPVIVLPLLLTGAGLLSSHAVVGASMRNDL